ncbi:integrase core domain-containing protein [Purpureocillium lavendulum]|uniref:Integrase core domain-containing protein n=1 Tax=Purpureocillium lavendulum TaxID=1247861 RepID=A0AB34FAV8_9HYPO|nr:integrase core domain-containing protein [Purpureocillium lavendulum]
MAARSEVTLSRPSEWTAWYEDFVSRAETSKIFDFVDIEKDSPTLEEPLEPLTSDEMLDRINKAAYDYWTMAMHTDAATAGPRPDPAADLTDAQWTRLGRLQSEYKVKLATFANRQRAYAELAIWVRSTVDKAYLGNTTSKSDLRTIVRDLKSSLAPSEDEQKEEARLRCRQVLTQTKRVKPEDWLVVWNKAKLEGEKHKIAELEGQSAVNDFLTAVSAFDATWASQQKVQIMNSKKFGLKMDVTIRALGELFHEHVRSSRASSRLADSAFAVTDATQSHCPCGLPSSKHRWKPVDCAAVQIAINGESKDGRRVKPNRVKICKETLKQAKWKSLIDTVKASASTPKTDQQDEHESTVPRSRKHGDFVGLTIDANGLTGGHTDSVFAALREKHPLYNSTIYDCSDCPVEWSVYQYRPSLPANIIFLALFAIAGAVHIFLGVKWRSWGFMSFMIFGCLVETIGYIGRIVLYNNPFSFGGFMVQIIFISTGPVFYTGAIYVTLSQTIEHLAPRLSRFKPKLFYWIFIPADLVCLVLQAAGGALSTTSSGSSTTGVDVAMTGLALQVAVLFIFSLLFADYMVRFMCDSSTPPLSSRVRRFLSGLSLAIALILGRSIYRCYELSKGYRDSDLITDQGLFIALEGVLIVIAVFALCIGHPGLSFSMKASTRQSSISSDVQK